MDEDTGRAIQTTAGVIAVAAIVITVLATQPTGRTEIWATVGGGMTLIASLLGVHYSLRWARNGHSRRKD